MNVIKRVLIGMLVVLVVAVFAAHVRGNVAPVKYYDRIERADNSKVMFM